ncbi:MAG: hypothetical protein LBN32_02030 [Helicobacteraceae bacterium]|jgi:hypothetical protein|nr:hypothetical protein [Helicobacteraceae bacterium]
MKELFLATMIMAAVLAGCGGRSAFFDFTGSAAYAEAIAHTKSGAITDRFESKALLSASYLNAIYPNRYSGDETFLVGLYITNDFQREKSGINNPMYSLALNDRKYIGVETVDKNDDLLKLMPMINRWSKYYIVRFEPSEKLDLTLSEADTNRSVTLSFSKANAE